MSMRMSMGMGLEQRVEMSMTHVIKMRLNMVATLRDELQSLLNDGEFSPNNRYDEIVQRVVSHTKQDYREWMTGLLMNASVKKQMLDSPLAMARPTEEKLQKKIVDVLYSEAEMAGGFCLEEGGQEVERPTTRDLLVQAFLKPDWLQKEIDDILTIIKSGSGPGAFQELKEMENAQKVQTAFAPYAQQLLQSLMLAFTTKEGNDDLILMNFFRDLVILEKLLFLESDRIQKRFASRFSKVNSKTKPDECELPMLNVIGEYTLVSVGIVAPEVFNLRHASLDAEAVELAQLDADAEGVNLKGMMKKHGLKDSGHLFWHRYAIQGMRPTVKTDNAVNEFITDTLRRERTKLLESVEYPVLFERVKEINAEPFDEDKNDTEAAAKIAKNGALRQVLVDHLRKPEFRKVILQLASTDWFSRLGRFMHPEKQK